MKKTAFVVALIAFTSATPLFSGPAVGQSAVITLVMPYGARSAAMGEVGTALADDASAIYFNPAGLDAPNPDFQGGAGSLAWQNLLPAFRNPDLWQIAISASIQDSSLWVSPGFFFNHINIGSSQQFDELGRFISNLRSYENVFGLAFGFDFADVGLKNHYFGLTAKYYNSALAPGIEGAGTGIGQGFAIDLGYLWTIGKYFRFGATLMNMGPSVYYLDPKLRDPIPFTINLGLGYKRDFSDCSLPISIAGELRLDREIVKNYGNGNPDPFWRAIYTNLLHDTLEQDRTFADQMQLVCEHLGGEITIYNTLSLRLGALADVAGQRYELHYGFGLNILNHFHFDLSAIYSPEGFMKSLVQKYESDQEGSSGARDGQVQITLTLDRALNWKPSDMTWYERK